MKRQRVRNAEYRELLEQNDGTHDGNDDQRNIQMQIQQRQRRRQENTLEAQIQSGDTLQAIALRYNCTISDLKRLNKIEKEIEIHARKTIKVPINAHTILLNTANFDELPIVHKSGQSSPHHGGESTAIYTSGSSSKDLGILTSTTTTTSQQQLQPNQQPPHQLYHPQNNHYPNHNHQLPNKILDEKLLVASVSLAANNIDRTRNGGANVGYRSNKSDLNGRNDDDDDEFSFTDPLIGPTLAGDACELYTTATTATDDPDFQRGPHAIRGTPRSEFTCNGSDCDISWICLLIFILALCFAIPLIYIIYIAEHPEQFHKENEPLGTVG